MSGRTGQTLNTESSHCSRTFDDQNLSIKVHNTNIVLVLPAEEFSSLPSVSIATRLANKSKRKLFSQNFNEFRNTNSHLVGIKRQEKKILHLSLGMKETPFFPPSKNVKESLNSIQEAEQSIESWMLHEVVVKA